MVTDIELIRAQTKCRPKEHQKLPSKKPLVSMIIVNAYTLWDCTLLMPYVVYDELRL